MDCRVAVEGQDDTSRLFVTLSRTVVANNQQARGTNAFPVVLRGLLLQSMAHRVRTTFPLMFKVVLGLLSVFYTLQLTALKLQSS